MAAAITIDERVSLPASAMTHAGFRAWATSASLPRGVRATFVDGEVILDMSPEAIESHNKVKTRIAAVLQELAMKDDLGEVYGDGVLVTHEAASLSSEPDATFVSWSTFESGRARLVEKANREEDYIEIVGAPDVVVEVVSDSSERKDLRLLRAAYLRAGVGEYWVIDARREVLSFEIFVRRGDQWETPTESDAPQRSAAFARTFTLSRSRNRAGRWSYDLTMSERLG
ncbi:MAG TPA: Uma2 family endonuclease [Polyangiaceae bacterium]|jgi:Uma2 family endonuclease